MRTSLKMQVKTAPPECPLKHHTETKYQAQTVASTSSALRTTSSTSSTMRDLKAQREEQGPILSRATRPITKEGLTRVPYSAIPNRLDSIRDTPPSSCLMDSITTLLTIQSTSHTATYSSSSCLTHRVATLSVATALCCQ